MIKKMIYDCSPFNAYFRKYLKKVKRILELFCGTKSVGKVAKEYGFEVVSVDIESKFKPTILTSILDWDYKKMFPIGYFDIIWASPPCATFSNFQNSWIGRLNKNCLPDEVFNKEMMLERQETIGVPMLNRAKKIIKYFKPTYFFIENPQTGRMKEYMEKYKYTDVCYCRYGFDYKKPTRIWHNNDDFLNYGLKCNHLRNHRHARLPNTLEGKYAIPPALIRDVFECCPSILLN